MAEKEIIRSFQRRPFGKDLISLGKEKCFQPCSSIVKLDPFIHDEGILKVGGRVQRAALANEMQGPVLLPNSYRTSELAVRCCHELVVHAD